MARSFLFLSSLSGFLSVALGAFAAHGLKQRLDDYHLSVFRTGVEYQFYHCFALALVGLLLLRGLTLCFARVVMLFCSERLFSRAVFIFWL